MKITIQKGIAIPARAKRSTKKYPFADMEVGDSFFVRDTKTPDKTRNTIASAASYYKKKNKRYNFYTKLYVTGVRIWRVE
jgi:hypothetical protein